jgi:mannose-6-phosphate isomerase
VRRIYRLINPIQEYAWGSRTAIPELLGAPSPAEKPQAELWLGAHPKAPSQVVLESGRRIPLPELIGRDPRAILGAEAAARFSNHLPFLFKVLAAAQPLSIQAHPDPRQARRGFRRENELGIAADDFTRNYRDENHKPEVICALTPFWALNGFRRLADMLSLLQSVGFRSIAAQIESLRSDPGPQGLRRFFAAVMNLDARTRQRALEEALLWARRTSERTGLRAGREEARWIIRLQELYPGDIGVLSPLLLNLVRLAAGEAMYMQAGVLHAYLEGSGVELMANSDNVIRGGLTPKHVDVPELLAILRFEGGTVRLAKAREGRRGERVFQTPAEEFRLAEIRLAGRQLYRSPRRRSVEIMICIEAGGRIQAIEDRGGEPPPSLQPARGDSFLVPAAVAGYTIRGPIRLYKASVPLAGTQDRENRV